MRDRILGPPDKKLIILTGQVNAICGFSPVTCQRYDIHASSGHNTKESTGTPRRKGRTDVAESSSSATKGGSGSGRGIVSYGALRCESVTDENSPSSASREGHMITIALSPITRPKPLQEKKKARPAARSKVNPSSENKSPDLSATAAEGEGEEGSRKQ